MNSWQQIFIYLYIFLNLAVFLKGFYESSSKKNPYGLTHPLVFLGIFVWGDAVIFAPFWVISSITALILNDWYLFLLIISVFWVVRSFGETIYWLNQQFSTLNRDPVKTLRLHSIFDNESIWFIHQIFWQCATVVSIISAIFITKLWVFK